MKTDRYFYDNYNKIFERMSNGAVRLVLHSEGADNDDIRMITKSLNSHREWALALQSLTPGGSEFVDDPKRCFDQVRYMLDNRLDSVKRLVIENRKLRTALESTNE